MNAFHPVLSIYIVSFCLLLGLLKVNFSSSLKQYLPGRKALHGGGLYGSLHCNLRDFLILFRNHRLDHIIAFQHCFRIHDLIVLYGLIKTFLALLHTGQDNLVSAYIPPHNINPILLIGHQ